MSDVGNTPVGGNNVYPPRSVTTTGAAINPPTTTEAQAIQDLAASLQKEAQFLQDKGGSDTATPSSVGEASKQSTKGSSTQPHQSPAQQQTQQQLKLLMQHPNSPLEPLDPTRLRRMVEEQHAATSSSVAATVASSPSTAAVTCSTAERPPVTNRMQPSSTAVQQQQRSLQHFPAQPLPPSQQPMPGMPPQQTPIHSAGEVWPAQYGARHYAVGGNVGTDYGCAQQLQMMRSAHPQQYATQQMPTQHMAPAEHPGVGGGAASSVVGRSPLGSPTAHLPPHSPYAGRPPSSAANSGHPSPATPYPPHPSTPQNLYAGPPQAVPSSPHGPSPMPPNSQPPPSPFTSPRPQHHPSQPPSQYMHSQPPSGCGTPLPPPSGWSGGGGMYAHHHHQQQQQMSPHFASPPPPQMMSQIQQQQPRMVVYHQQPPHPSQQRMMYSPHQYMQPQQSPQGGYGGQPRAMRAGYPPMHPSTVGMQYHYAPPQGYYGGPIPGQQPYYGPPQSPRHAIMRSPHPMLSPGGHPVRSPYGQPQPMHPQVYGQPTPMSMYSPGGSYIGTHGSQRFMQQRAPQPVPYVRGGYPLQQQMVSPSSSAAVAAAHHQEAMRSATNYSQHHASTATPVASQQSMAPQFYGHDPSVNVPRDLCLLGCVFLLVEYDRKCDQRELRDWEVTIVMNGGELELRYSERVTHVISDTFNNHIVLQALKEHKRLVTAQWLNDCVAQKRMQPPWKAMHLPSSPSYTEVKPAKGKLISLAGFDDSESACLQQMIVAIGGRYTAYLCSNHQFLIAKTKSGDKVTAAAEMKVSVVNSRWLMDMYVGYQGALTAVDEPNYQQYPPAFDPLRLDPLVFLNPFPAPYQQAISAWRTPLILSTDVWRVACERKENWENDPRIFPHKRISLNVPSPPSDVATETNKVETATDDKTGDDGYKVVFSGLYAAEVENLSKKLKHLGGCASVEDIYDADLLICSDLKQRTQKLLEAIALGKYVVLPSWINDGYSNGKLSDPLDYIVKDDGIERFFGFNLKTSLCLARNRPLFENTVFYVSPSVRPSLCVIADLLHAAGGRPLTEAPPLCSTIAEFLESNLNFVAITCEEDVHLCQKLAECGISLQSVEFVLTGLLRQEADMECFKINYKEVLGINEKK